MDPRPHSATPRPAKIRHAGGCACEPCFADRVRAAQRAVARLVAIGSADGVRLAREQRADAQRLPLRGARDYTQAADLVRAFAAEGGDPGPSDAVAADLGALALLASEGRAQAFEARKESAFSEACVTRPACTGRTDLPCRDERPGAPKPATVSGGVPGFWSKSEARMVRGNAVALQSAYRIAGHDRHAEGGDCAADCAGCRVDRLRTARARAEDPANPGKVRKYWAHVAHALAKAIAAHGGAE